MALALATVLAPLPAVSAEQPVDINNIALGARWLLICTSERRSDEAMCSGFIMGLEETQFLSEFKPLYCPPPMFTVDDQKGVIVRFLKANPGRHGEPFARLAADAMRRSFPCRN